MSKSKERTVDTHPVKRSDYTSNNSTCFLKRHILIHWEHTWGPLKEHITMMNCGFNRPDHILPSISSLLKRWKPLQYFWRGFKLRCLSCQCTMMFGSQGVEMAGTGIMRRCGIISSAGTSSSDWSTLMNSSCPHRETSRLHLQATWGPRALVELCAVCHAHTSTYIIIGKMSSDATVSVPLMICLQLYRTPTGCFIGSHESVSMVQKIKSGLYTSVHRRLSDWLILLCLGKTFVGIVF